MDCKKFRPCIPTLQRKESISKAEGEGFEPPVGCATTVFKTVALDRSAIPPFKLRFEF